MDSAMAGLSHKPRMPKGMKDERKHGISEIHIKMNHDGSHHITHHMVNPKIQSTMHSAKDREELHDHLEEHLGGKPTDAEMAEGEETETPPMMSK